MRHALAAPSRLFALGLVLWAGCAVAAEPPALLTLLEGEATLISGARASFAQPGSRVAPGTIIETDAKATLLRLEWPDGSTLDLGPATRVMVRPPQMSVRKPPQFYLLQGWAKQSQAALAGGQVGTAAEVAPFKGVLVSHAEDGQTMLFSESGGVQLTPRKGGASMTLAAGQAASFAPGVAPQVLPRPPGPWLARVPKVFRETIPTRAARFKGPEPAPRPKGALSYAGLQAWLTAEPALRRELPPRFAELLNDRAFRDAVQAQLAQHPEWEPWLKNPKAAARTEQRTARKNNPESEAPR